MHARQAESADEILGEGQPDDSSDVIRFESLIRLVDPQCHLAYFDHAAGFMFSLARTGLLSLMAGGASWRVPCWPGFLTG